MPTPSGRPARVPTIIMLLVIGAFTASCSSSDDTGSDAETTSTTATSATTAPTSTTAPTTTSSTTTTSPTATTTTTTIAPADPDAIVDTWNIVRGDVIIYEADGSYGVYVEVGDDAFDSGTYAFDGVLLTMIGDPDSPYCPGETGTYIATFPEDQTADIDVVEDPCGQRRNGLTFGLVRYQPEE